VINWKHFVGALDIELGFTHLIQKDLSSSPDQSTLRTFFFICLGFRDFTWLSLNNLLHLTGLVCVSASASNAAFTGVSVKTALTPLFCLQFSLSAYASIQCPISTGLICCRLKLMLKPRVEGWLLTCKFEFEE
jgi:hypothetical protein